jgi:hypothetical protein
MPDYSNGKIYTIRNRNDDTKIYVGSTIQPLYKRYHQHKKDSAKKEKYPNHKLYTEIENWDDWYIELYENYPCNNKEELCQREGEVIRLIGNLNKQIAGRDKKQWYIENADKVQEKNKKYHAENADKIKEYKKQYNIENKEKLQEYRRQYYLKKTEKLNKKISESTAKDF